MANIKSCTIRKEGGTKYQRCKKVVFGVIRVKIFHPNSIRTSSQTWYLCKEHFNQFMNVKGKDWGCSYRDETKGFCPVVGYEII